MLDFSFIRLKDNFDDAKNINDRSVTEIYYFDYIHLSPLEAYTQITNVSGGISFGGSYKVEIVDCAETVLQDITPNVFIEEFTGEDGNTQIKFEVINITTDYYNKTVYFKFSSTISDDAYYSNPLKVTDYQKEQTTFFQYKNYDNYKGIGYENAQVYQSIRLKTYFDIPIDESEISNYFQISRNREISARVLDKQFERYQIDYIHRFGYDRTNALLKHDVIYVDGARMTNKAFIESNDMLSDSNVFNSNFTIAKNYNDTLDYEYQIFEGIKFTPEEPIDTYTLATLNDQITGSFNVPITINEGTLTIYNALDDSVMETYTQADITIEGGSGILIDGALESIVSNGNYYIQFDAGLFSFVGIEFEGINNKTDWAFVVQDADYDSADYSSVDYLTN